MSTWGLTIQYYVRYWVCLADNDGSLPSRPIDRSIDPILFVSTGIGVVFRSDDTIKKHHRRLHACHMPASRRGAGRGRFLLSPCLPSPFPSSGPAPPSAFRTGIVVPGTYSTLGTVSCNRLLYSVCARNVSPQNPSNGHCWAKPRITLEGGTKGRIALGIPMIFAILLLVAMCVS